MSGDVGGAGDDSSFRPVVEILLLACATVNDFFPLFVEKLKNLPGFGYFLGDNSLHTCMAKCWQFELTR